MRAALAVLAVAALAASPGIVSARPRQRRRLAGTTAVLDLAATTSTVGSTPAIIGVNLGHRYPNGSNWAQWMARLGVNSARVFLTATWGLSLESWVGSSRWGQSLSGSPVTDEASFQAAVAELRTPAGHDPALVSRFANPVKWSKFDTKFVTTDTDTPADEQEGNHNATLTTLLRLHPGTPPLVVIGCGAGSVKDSDVLDTSDSRYWASHWELFKHVYAFCRYLHRANITQIEIYNEPDLDNDFELASGGFNEGLWVDQMALRSRAVQDAFADFNADSGKSLQPVVTVGAFAKTTYGDGKLGQPSVRAMHRTFADASRPNPDPSWRNVHQYSYHSYGQSGKSILDNFRGLLNESAADRQTYGNFPFSITEHNAKTSGDFSDSDYNMDTPSMAAKLAAQSLHLASAGGDGLASIYAFKFSVTLSSSNGVAKNGIHFGDNRGAPYSIGDATLGAEGLRLIAEHLRGSQPLLGLTSANAASLADVKALAVRSGPAYYVYVVNTGDDDTPVTLKLSGWGVAPGTPVTVERVNASTYGEVTEVLSASGSDASVSTTAYVDNLLRIRVPASPVRTTTLSASAASYVRAGSQTATNFINGCFLRSECSEQMQQVAAARQPALLVG